ncbi:hypothetical protein F503_04075 [Ophiostoma piceae UAMH 11346]|uniref:Uncharacterized protein n=1 Tax=Ophiostoma piceae (strain UAMH 11346) TaxID=1262450 RepID=S3BTK9_OPHP1|nr:hypothetical protein F503_04075 [Ophiostoma piceae UAMH 11346]
MEQLHTAWDRPMAPPAKCVIAYLGGWPHINGLLWMLTLGAAAAGYEYPFGTTTSPANCMRPRRHTSQQVVASYAPQKHDIAVPPREKNIMELPTVL